VAVLSLFSQLADTKPVVVSLCRGQCPTYQFPDASRNSKLVIHHVYAAGLNSQTGLADWLAYRMTKESVGVASLLSRSWQADRLVDTPDELEIIEITDLRSHWRVIVKATILILELPFLSATRKPRTVRANYKFSNTPYWTDLNNLTNMVSMPSLLRLAAWLRLEQSLNTLLSLRDELYVITGALSSKSLIYFDYNMS
jgi:endonuclease G